MKKLIFLFIMILTLTGCKTVEISTSYGNRVTNQKEEEIYNKVQIDGDTIVINKFKKNIKIEKYSGLDDAFSKGIPRKEIFSGTVEDYKKQKK